MRLILADYALSDVLAAYEHVYREYGRFAEVEQMVQQRAGGASWDAVLTACRESQEPCTLRFIG